MGVRFEKDPDYMLVFVPERRFTDTLMTRPDPKRAHKMSRKGGHYQKVRRPTNLEVYNDASKILEELLEKRIDRDLRVQNRQKRNKTDPNAERITSIAIEPDNPVARSKTMPSKYRESPNIDPKRKELDVLLRKEIEKHAENGFVSSADTEAEGEGSVSMEKRKKKSLFKLAKERLIHTFNRDQKSGIGKVKEKSESPNVKRRKPKKKPDKEHGETVSETNRHIKARLNKDNSVDYTEEVEYRDKSDSIHTDIHLRNSRSSSFSRNALLSSIRKPFRKNKHDSRSDNIINSKSTLEKEDHRYEPSPISPQPSTAVRQSGTARRTDPSHPPPPPRLDGIPAANSSPCRGRGSSPSKSPSPHMDVVIQAILDGRPNPLSSSSSALPTSDHPSPSVGSLNILTSIQSNVLDSPGEDIEFMDVRMEQRVTGVRYEEEDGRGLYGSTSSIHAAAIKFHTSEGLLNFNWLADQTADRAKTMDYEIDERSVSRLRPDGDMETTTTVTAVRTVVMPDVEEMDENDQVDGDEPDKPMNKEELYGKIAQKLIAMADTYGGSLSEAEAAGAAAAARDLPLTDLEKEIIACLRSKDKYSKEVEEQMMETAMAQTNTYQRFRSTVQNSLGTELSWNHLAFVFYTTKGVVSALGKGSQAANQAKDFSLQYITDTFASWIMDQGGFDSMLSCSESDPEID